MTTHPAGRITAKPVLATSLKMYFDHDQTLAWSRQIREIALRSPAVMSRDVNLIVFPSFPSLKTLVDLFADTPITVGAQNMAVQERGAYTGEVSVHTLKQIGCTHVEIGHAERRRLFGETTADMQRKTALALKNQLTPLICLGEAELLSPAHAAATCIEFISEVTAEIAPDNTEDLVFAYEPEWAIGAKEPAEPEYVQAVVKKIKSWLQTQPALANAMVIYGGSAGPGLLASLNGSVNGLFLGRFAHDPAAFEEILHEL